MKLFDVSALERLQAEFRLSMKALLRDLYEDIDAHYQGLAKQIQLPVAYIRFLSHAFDQAAYSNWKVVGWIEGLNDLVYLLDLLQQLMQERDRKTFAEQLFIECEQKFFENSYLDELFPEGRQQFKGLATRLQRLCTRLAGEVAQEAVFINPKAAMQWSRKRGVATWTVSGRLAHNFERAERTLTIPIGTGGDELIAPRSVVKAVGGSSQRVDFEVSADGVALKKGCRMPICSLQDAEIDWHWSKRAAVKFATTPFGSSTVGPTLRYGNDRQPKDVVPTDSEQVARIARAWKLIRQAWPEGYAVLEVFTSRIIPLRARGVVSFSYRHRPGLSFINCFDRDNLDLIDDLIHENSHHYLNLLLRKHVMYQGDHNQQIFYSPWRRSLRPIRGILHATFTFTMGALLFERLSAWGQRDEGAWREAGLTNRDLFRARFRCLEEIESVRYSICDLDYAGRQLKWITGSGARLVRQLEEELSKAEQRIAKHRKAVLASIFGPALRKHIKELQRARQTYGPVRLSKA